MAHRFRRAGPPRAPGDGRSRRGFTCKIHILCDRNGYPLHFHLSAGQAHEASVFDTLMVGADEQLIHTGGTPICWPVALAGDKGYRADLIDDYLLGLDIMPVIPSKSNEDRDARPITFDKHAYLIGWLKGCRRIFSRFEKTAKNIAGMIRKAFIQRYLRLAVE